MILYLLEANLSLLIFYAAYRLLFQKDRNFPVRRLYLMSAMVLSLAIPMLPSFTSIAGNGIPSLAIPLEGITVLGSGEGSAADPVKEFSILHWLWMTYLGVVFLGAFRLLVQIAWILRESGRSEKRIMSGISFYSSRKLHASSFFNRIFIDERAVDEKTFRHILAHEQVHQLGWHSFDRILAELLVVAGWFNPVTWMLRRSLVENLEYLADSAIVRNGIDPLGYQMSILNQYIGSASITNQFSSQIKNRINMLNRNHKPGSSWKITLLFPIAAIALIIASCADTEEARMNQTTEPEVEEVTGEAAEVMPDALLADEPVFRVVEEMPTFQGSDPVASFRKYIAQNIRYPKEAAENGVTGKIFIQFVVDREGKVIVPDLETFAKIEGKPMDEVVVAAYRTLENGEAVPEEKYIRMLEDEVIRVVSSSPKWEPGRQRGTAVNVAFTFPVTFALQ